MNTTILKTARRIWCVGHADRDTQRANIRKWVRSLRQLGDRWVLATQDSKLITPIPDGKLSSLALPFPLRTPRSLNEAFAARGQV
ncbi:hypothetical protein UFOVP37_81 [uncultured Caudovirales phage]|uniref:Uncharacterized protein n=1 Tax=uncultured Caudovirales phage TaxID=2100421 RepID=A0A6J5KPR4_9CAUD|nr:hypothetical protein UFOVP37_81 [uncultured Caudovirales phage]